MDSAGKGYQTKMYVKRELCKDAGNAPDVHRVSIVLLEPI
jgi:hypothetical protein